MSNVNYSIITANEASSGSGIYGGIFTFGDAQFFGSMGGQHQNKPVVGGATPG